MTSERREEEKICRMMWIPSGSEINALLGRYAGDDA
ncbi:Uncharacterised protein [Citrobacter portucalensis]|nr:Uncharacterised protein [Citrobacter portucalensis]